MALANKIPLIITISAAAYAIIALWQAFSGGGVVPESICLIVILFAIAVLSWTEERFEDILSAKEGAVIWAVIVLFLLYGVLKGGALI